MVLKVFNAVFIGTKHLFVNIFHNRMLCLMKTDENVKEALCTVDLLDVWPLSVKLGFLSIFLKYKNLCLSCTNCFVVKVSHKFGTFCKAIEMSL